MQRLGRIIGSLSLVAASASIARAQTPLSLTLDEAVQRAVERAPRLAEARARTAAAAAAIGSRASLRLPTFTATSSYFRTNHVDEFGLPQANGTIRVLFPDIPDNYRVRGELAVPLLTGGRVDALVQSAQQEVRATEADRTVAEEDVRLDCARAYWTLVTARASVTVLEQALQRMDAWVGDVRSRVTAGVLPPNDLLSAQAQRARQNVQLIQAKNTAAMAEIDLGRLVGAPVGQPIAATSPVDQPLAAASTLETESADALIARARDHRAERAGLQSRQTAQRVSAAAAWAATRPQVGALAAVEPARPNERFVPRTDQWKTSWDLGVNVSWPIWDGGRARADRAAALAQADATGHRLEEFDAVMAVEVRQRLLELESNRAALQAAGEAVASATEARRVVGERFTAGVATSTDVLDAQVALLQAELERTQISAALRLGEARLLRALGAL